MCYMHFSCLVCHFHALLPSHGSHSLCCFCILSGATHLCPLLVQGVVLLKSANELLDFNRGEEQLIEEVRAVGGWERRRKTMTHHVGVVVIGS